jgi:DNA-directed RNA polymerase specialized sigma24 family protein
MAAERPVTEKPGSVTPRIPDLQRGDKRAVQVLWEHYYEQLVRIAAARLRGAPCRAGDGEDIAVEAFLGFCAEIQKGRFTDLASRDNLIRLLVRFTIFEAFDFSKREKRRHEAVRGDSALGEAGFTCLPGDEPPPELQAQLADLLAKLPDEELRAVARLRLAGYTNAQIAEELHGSVSAVELKLALIRKYWKADWAELKGENEPEETT